MAAWLRHKASYSSRAYYVTFPRVCVQRYTALDTIIYSWQYISYIQNMHYHSACTLHDQHQSVVLVLYTIGIYMYSHPRFRVPGSPPSRPRVQRSSLQCIYARRGRAWGRGCDSTHTRLNAYVRDSLLNTCAGLRMRGWPRALRAAWLAPIPLESRTSRSPEKSRNYPFGNYNS